MVEHESQEGRLEERRSLGGDVMGRDSRAQLAGLYGGGGGKLGPGLPGVALCGLRESFPQVRHLGCNACRMTKMQSVFKMLSWWQGW